MNDLLKQWQKLDPGAATRFQSYWSKPLSGEFSRANPVHQALLEAAVREAVEERGWTWRLERDPELEAEYLAHVFARIPVEGKSFRHLEQFTIGSDFSPAHALLEAYLEALEAERGAVDQ